MSGKKDGVFRIFFCCSGGLDFGERKSEGRCFEMDLGSFKL